MGIGQLGAAPQEGLGTSGIVPVSIAKIEGTPLARIERCSAVVVADFQIRTAIDRFKDAADQGLIAPLELEAGNEGYPEDLEQLVDGVAANNDATGRKLKFLRRIPIDPMTHTTDWGLRSYQDDPDDLTWGGDNVFDVHTTFNGTALDGTNYRDW